ncbi:Immunoglobulin superfamily containing leucine-rich repeat [Mactra antiquata]
MDRQIQSLRKHNTMATTQMKTSQFLTVLIIFNLVFAVHCQEACGDKCSCIQTSTTFSYDCRARQLTVAPVGVSSNATTLNLSNNQIRMLIQGSFNNLRKLEYLYLQANEISYIQPGTLNGMMRLKQLIISSNLLTEIERDTFAHLPSLEVLDLSQNRITTINRYALFTLPSLYLVNFAQNSLICGCEEMMLQEFFDQRGSDLIVDNALCVNYGVDLSLIRSVNAMPCPTIATERLFQDDMRCYSCSGAKGVRDCITDQVQLCSGATDFYKATYKNRQMCFIHVFSYSRAN